MAQVDAGVAYFKIGGHYGRSGLDKCRLRNYYADLRPVRGLCRALFRRRLAAQRSRTEITKLFCCKLIEADLDGPPLICSTIL